MPGDFSWRKTKDGRVRISRADKLVTTLAGPKAQRFLDRAVAVGDAGEQQLMARATGNYRRGNER